MRRWLIILMGLSVGGCAGWVRLPAGAGPGAARLLEGFEQALRSPRTSVEAASGQRLEARLVKAPGSGQALCLDVDTGNGAVEAAFDFVPSGLGRAASLTVEGRALRFSALAPPGLRFTVGLAEASPDGGEGPVFLAPDLTGAGRWKRYRVPLASFYPSLYAGPRPAGAAAKPTRLAGLQVQVLPGQGAATLCLDEITLY
jgi:hypothetical protein